MIGALYKRIMLSGSLAGAVRISSGKGGSVLELDLAGLSEGMNVYTVSAGSIIKTELSSARFDVGQTGIYAVAVEKDGRLVSAGFSGGTRAEKNRILDELRIRAAGEYEERTRRTSAPESGRETPPAEPPKPEKTAGSAKDAPQANKAEVTERILKQAERLFAALSAEEEDPGPAPVPVKNPFPKTYPRSEWRMIPGDERLYGTVVTAGREVRLTALPALTGQKNARPPFRSRPIVSADGKRYFIVRYEEPPFA